MTALTVLPWIVFSTIVILLGLKIKKCANEHVPDYGINFEPLLYSILLIAFVLIWGGIFWW